MVTLQSFGITLLWTNQSQFPLEMGKEQNLILAYNFRAADSTSTMTTSNCRSSFLVNFCARPEGKSLSSSSVTSNQSGSHPASRSRLNARPAGLYGLRSNFDKDSLRCRSTLFPVDRDGWGTARYPLQGLRIGTINADYARRNHRT